MKSFDNRQLAQLGSMKDLQAAKRKINRAINKIENGVRDEYEAAKEMFSWRDALCYGFTIIDTAQSVLRYLGKGLFTSITSGISNAVGHRREKRSAGNCGCGCD